MYNFSYIKRFADNPETYKVGEWDIPMPIMPQEKEMVNYDKKIKDQKYQRIIFPNDFIHRSDSEKDEIAFQLLVNHRNNGRWILIKGEPFYFPYEADIYYSFYFEEHGAIPDFRLEGLEYFYFLDYAWNQPNIFGTVDIKPRRIGDTGKTLCYGYCGAIKYRNYRFGMQNIKDEDAEQNYWRIVNAHKRMPPVYKPIMPGKEDPKTGMEFRYPGKHISTKNLEDGTGRSDYNANLMEMNSLIDYRPTKFKEYDGHRLSFYHMDEPGKIINMDVIEQLGVIRRCVSLHDEEQIIGKIALTTTIEDMKDGYTVDVMQRLWDDASPEQMKVNGRTLNGLIRVVRTAYDNAIIDEWGFPKKKEAKKSIETKIKMFEKEERFLDKTSFLRRSPRNIEDALKPPEVDVDLLPELLDRQIDILMTRGSKAVQGNLYWEHGSMWNEKGEISNVKWRPTSKGRWFISQQPIRPNAMKRNENDRLVPANKHFYAVGIDPTDTRKNDVRSAFKSYMDRLSLQGIVVERVFDPSIDNEQSGIQKVGKEILNPEILQTGKPVCTYLYRHNTPHKNFEDVLMTLQYYGTDGLIERNKAYVKNKFEELDLQGYLQYKPRQAFPDWKRGIPKEVGVHATEYIVDLYIELMREDIEMNVLANEHLDLLHCQRKFNRENRGKRDLSVARGFSKIACYTKDVRMRKMEKNKIEAKEVSKDVSIGFKTYKRVI